MEWNDLYPSDSQPTLEEIADYISGDAKALWQELIDYMERAYKAKPKLTYSVCSGKPGWNVKFQKSGQSFGTLYPEESSFSVFMVISYKLESIMESTIPKLSPELVELYRNAGDFMKQGRWFMFRITDRVGLEDFKKLAAVKLAPKLT